MSSSSSTMIDILNIVRQCISYIYYVILISGIIGNILNILIFTQLKRFRYNRGVLYFIIESIVGIIFIIISMINSIFQTIYKYDIADSVVIWCKIRFMLVQSMSLILFFTICCAACDQFCSTSHYFPIRNLCTLKLARILIFVICLFGLFHGIMFGYFLNIQPSIGCIITNSILALYSTYFFYPIFFGPIQIIIAFLFSLLSYYNVRHIIRRQIPIVRRRLDRQITAMFLTRVLFFIIFALPFTIYRIYIINNPLLRVNNLYYTIGQVIQIILNSLFSMNFTSNFYIFMLISSQYRRQMKYVLIKKCWQQCQHYFCCIRQNRVYPTNKTSTNSNDEL